MVNAKQDTEQPAVDPTIKEGDADQGASSTYQNYLLPEANNGQGRAVKARSLSEAVAKAEKLDKENGEAK